MGDRRGGVDEREDGGVGVCAWGSVGDRSGGVDVWVWVLGGLYRMMLRWRRMFQSSMQALAVCQAFGREMVDRKEGPLDDCSNPGGGGGGGGGVFHLVLR